jgi:hypothetical protein
VFVSACVVAFLQRSPPTMTNWDAATLAGLVRKGTPVVFEE